MLLTMERTHAQVHPDKIDFEIRSRAKERQGATAKKEERSESRGQQQQEKEDKEVGETPPTR